MNVLFRSRSLSIDLVEVIKLCVRLDTLTCQFYKEYGIICRSRVSLPDLHEAKHFET